MKKFMMMMAAVGAAMLAPAPIASVAHAQGVELRLGPNGVAIGEDRDRAERRQVRREMQQRRAYEEGRRDGRRQERRDRVERRWDRY